MIAPIKRFRPALLALFAGAVVLLPVVIWGVPNNNDLANHYHFALPFYEAIQRGDIHPGWLASPNFGYGDAVVRFYPPALYYLLAAGRALTGNWYSGSLLVLTLLSALGSFAAYFWAGSYVPRHTAVWAAVFYAFMPYHLAEVYQAAQLAEFAAGAALLFSLAFTKRLCDHGRVRDLAGLAASYALLILSHLPLAVFGSLALLVYTLLNIPKDRVRSTIPKLTTAVLLGLAASSFYWTTMVAEMKWIVADGVNPDPLLDYRRNFVFSTFSPEKNETIWWMGLLAIGTIMMLLPGFVIFGKKFSASGKRALPAVAVLAAFSLVMSTQISKPVWAAIPFLPMAQHPFRWLAVTSAVAPILMAASVPFWVERLRRPRRAVALAMAGLVLIAASFSISQTVRGATYLARPTFEQMLKPLHEAPGIIQWLPVWANASAQGKASYEKCVPPPVTPAKIEAGERAVRINEWNDLSRTFEVDSGRALEAHVSTFYYPHWTATANGQALPTRPAADGALSISLPPEQATVTLQFREPARAKLSSVVSIISWTLLASFLIFGAFVSQHEPTEARREQSN
ncbi:MAG TPA: 6-pyruvoyl-tetrahydropterin synthase-related protein [Pyrinomonadaceae bacterium]|nr:6-pyruvoyl-tetrahydropterin synthase-related protein [Pyrinomonadaceae bacterium]